MSLSLNKKGLITALFIFALMVKILIQSYLRNKEGLYANLGLMENLKFSFLVDFLFYMPFNLLYITVFLLIISGLKSLRKINLVHILIIIIILDILFIKTLTHELDSNIYNSSAFERNASQARGGYQLKSIFIASLIWGLGYFLIERREIGPA